MIYLTKGQPLYDNPGIVVFDNTGYYEDGSSVLCAMTFAPDEPVSRFEAKFIAFGPMVYNISEPEKLLEEVKKLDPETLFGKSTADVSLDQKIQDLETVDTTKEAEAETEEEANTESEPENTENTEEIQSNPETFSEPVVPEQTSSSTDPISGPSENPVPEVPVEETVPAPIEEPLPEPEIPAPSEPALDAAPQEETSSSLTE